MDANVMNQVAHIYKAITYLPKSEQIIAIDQIKTVKGFEVFHVYFNHYIV
jgi:hypothetical protein